MKIRKMLIGDYENAYSLWLKTPGMGLNASDDSKAGIERFLLRNPSSCFVAEKGGGIIGVILSGNDGRRGLIYHLAVEVSEREQGVGCALLECAIDALQSEGIRKVYLMVLNDNDIGNAFWEKRGFSVPDGTLYRAREI